MYTRLNPAAFADFVLKIVLLFTATPGDLPRRQLSFSMGPSLHKEQLFQIQTYPDQLSTSCMQQNKEEWGQQKRKQLRPWCQAQGCLSLTFQSMLYWKVLQGLGGIPCDVLCLHINAAPHEGQAVSAWVSWYRNVPVTHNHYPSQEQTIADYTQQWRQSLNAAESSRSCAILSTCSTKINN